MKSVLGEDFWKFGEAGKTGESGEVRRFGESFSPGKGFRSLMAGIWLAGLLALLLICPLSAFAHPPGAVQISYLENEQVLQVTITHSSFMPNSHYIKKVEIQKNAEKPMVYEYTSQPDKTKFAYTYQIPLKEGDRVEVKVFCNLYGSWTGGLVMAKPAAK